MATYNVKFTWTLNDSSANPTDHVSLSVKDSTGAQIGQQTINPASQQQFWTLGLPAGTGHVATLTSYNSAGIPDPNPPQQTFNVLAVATPVDPTLNPPVQVA